MHHTLVALVEDKPGVLNRVASLMRRRAFNIESLTVGRTDEPGVSRMTFVIDGTQTGIDRVVANLYKLVNVLQVDDLTGTPAVSRDLALVKLSASPLSRARLHRTIDEVGGHVVDSGTSTVTVEITGEPPRIDHAIDRLRALGIVELVRTGATAMARGDRTIKADAAPAAAVVGQ
ncbi:MAG: acetolactate synthase small subunit [Acidobacteriota bacterium]